VIHTSRMLQADNWPLGSRLKRESAHVRGKSTVLIDTIQRFKSLESPIVILWGLDSIDLSQRQQELLNVGMSRAKSLLVIVGRAVTFSTFKEAERCPIRN